MLDSTCPFNNTLLTIQSHNYGMRLWCALCWRDIFRLAIFIALVCRVLFDDLGKYLLIPHSIFLILFLFFKVYQEIHQTPKEWCFYLLTLILMANLMTSIICVVIPSFSFYSLHWGQEYGDIPRLFTDCNRTKALTTRLLKYILNNNKREEIKRRIVVVNYYLTLLFADNIDDDLLSKIDYFADMHNSNTYGLTNVNWTDLQKAAGYNIHATKARWFKSILSLFVVIYDIVLLIFLQNKVCSAGSALFIICWLFIAMDCVFLLFDAKYFEIYWYCYHIFPFLDETHRIDEFCWLTKCGNIDVLMDNINVLYNIMFGSFEKVTLIENVWENIHPDIAVIIGQYLWYSLPTYRSYENENTFKLKSDKIIKSFKDCSNLSMLYINVHISTN